MYAWAQTGRLDSPPDALFFPTHADDLGGMST
jgi:hypothetical protein